MGIKIGVLCAGIASALLLGAVDAGADEKRHRWKMQSAFPKAFAHIGPMGQYFTDMARTTTGGAVDIKFYEPGALVPALSIMDSVSAGAIDSGYTAGAYSAGKVPQAALFGGTMPFGPSVGMQLAWFNHGGGRELYDKMWAPFNIKGLRCFMFSPESGGWFKKEIKSLDDLKGLKMRIAGLGANVLERFGVSTQLLAGGDVYPALELGTIDAADLGMAAVDIGIGVHNVAEYYYQPAWIQQVAFHEFHVNMDRWKDLSDMQREQMEAACQATIAHSYADSEALNPIAFEEFQKKGVQIRTFPKEVIAQLEAAWIEVAKEEAAKHPAFKEVWDSMTAFRTRYEAWADKVYLERGQLN